MESSNFGVIILPVFLRFAACHESPYDLESDF